MNVTPRMAGLLQELLNEFVTANTVTGATAPPPPPPPRAKALPRRAAMRAVSLPDETIEVSELNRQRARQALLRAGYHPKGT